MNAGPNTADMKKTAINRERAGSPRRRRLVTRALERLPDVGDRPQAASTSGTSWLELFAQPPQLCLRLPLLVSRSAARPPPSGSTPGRRSPGRPRALGIHVAVLLLCRQFRRSADRRRPIARMDGPLRRARNSSAALGWAAILFLARHLQSPGSGLGVFQFATMLDRHIGRRRCSPRRSGGGRRRQRCRSC